MGHPGLGVFILNFWLSQDGGVIWAKKTSFVLQIYFFSHPDSILIVLGSTGAGILTPSCHPAILSSCHVFCCFCIWFLPAVILVHMCVPFSFFIYVVRCFFFICVCPSLCSSSSFFLFTPSWLHPDREASTGSILLHPGCILVRRGQSE